ncbi:hypothetical protein Krac_5685 [Ktedonobacter racemifer DSM 44963]|uniref:Uncharacterized protein n=1 Tax=Ktedonobacter racemifer DSM 44963 TaxID=485913 RepID=D6TWM0_KTERA|nr:hypothetical protein Krac_5685 [Ktedonobacter racemifer DSM 44963]
MLTLLFLLFLLYLTYCVVELFFGYCQVDETTHKKTEQHDTMVS